MDLFEKVVDTVAVTGKELIGAAKETKDIMVLKAQIKSNEHEIAKQMYLIGAKYYEENKDVFDEEYEKYFTKIQLLKDENIKKEEEISRVGKP